MSLVPMNLSLSDLEIAIGPEVNARLYGDDVVLRSFSTDTRTITSGDLFIAVRGPNHDAHEHIELAVKAGACAVVVERRLAVEIPQLVVTNTRLALGMIAREWCLRSDAIRIGITGSNGKTTVKEMLSAILTAHGGDVHATPGNFNNDIGLPLTCLAISPTDKYAVLEMGTNSPGEISTLSHIARPYAAVVTQVAAAHLEGFGTLEAIAIEKASIFSGVSESGYALIPHDDEHFETLNQAAGHLKVRTFGFTDAADIRGSQTAETFSVTFSEKVIGPLAGKTLNIDFALLGQHNRLNALAAIAAASCVDVSAAAIEKALSEISAVSGRLQDLPTRHAARIIDDSYNANPASARAAIDVLAALPGVRLFVLGDMLELGADELVQHTEIGRYAKSRGIDALMTIGCLAAMAASGFGANAASFSDRRELALALRGSLNKDHTLLFKGSRGARMELVIADLLDDSLSAQPIAAAGEGPLSRSQRVVSL